MFTSTHDAVASLRRTWQIRPRRGLSRSRFFEIASLSRAFPSASINSQGNSVIDRPIRSLDGAPTILSMAGLAEMSEP